MERSIRSSAYGPEQSLEFLNQLLSEDNNLAGVQKIAIGEFHWRLAEADTYEGSVTADLHDKMGRGISQWLSKLGGTQIGFWEEAGHTSEHCEPRSEYCGGKINLLSKY